MNADELDELLDGLPPPSEVTFPVTSRPPPPPQSPPRAPRFLKFGVESTPTTGEEANAASLKVSTALAKRPIRVTASEWAVAFTKAENFWHANARRGADKFLSLPCGPRLRYHSWYSGKADDPDIVDILLLHDICEAGGCLSDLGVALSRRGYRVWAPDCRGHGDSDHSLPYSYTTLIEDLRSFIVELDLYRRPLIVVGFGFGSSVALAFTSTYEQLVGGLVLVDQDPCAASDDQYAFHPTQAATCRDVHGLIDLFCSRELLDLTDIDKNGRRDPVKALPRLRWAMRDDHIPSGPVVASKMDERWCFEKGNEGPRVSSATILQIQVSHLLTYIPDLIRFL